MNIIKNIFARVWALWGLVTFIITFLLIFPASMLSHYFKPYKKGQDYFIKVSKVWMDVWLFLIGCSVKLYGKEHFVKGKPYIVIFNHNALLDVPLSAPYVPGPSKTIAKSSFAKVPIFGAFYKRGAILVDRKQESSRIRSYEEMKKVLQQGMHMSIYPEGTRNRSNAPLKPFYDGAFKLAVETQKDIMPCIIIGTKKAMPINKFFYLLPTKLTMTFLPPISSINIEPKVLKEKAFTEMTNFYVANNK
jgi:1-acyl-sn-glycerol-3-phosphate acyltransferase